ncbi:hypothetical protein QYE76_013038 [Lolium multiflorum]|uniref:Uncharacterized protein n=1 Tax=Lolium multiflorum TaxID=4521 RepID=A0AAD8TZY8_LOLMU|nr:hypothetical protein QYE76_013038 [Lolium multiflorum]
MAEAVVGQLVVKLGSALAKEALTFGAALLCKEASALRGLFGRIRDSKAELESMQAYLQEAERFKDTDKTTAIFVGEIRGLAFQIEDVVDEFTYKLEDCRHGGLFANKMRKRLKHIKTWRRLAAKLQEIEGKLQDAKRRKKDYSISRSASGARSKNQGQALHFTSDEDLVGIQGNKHRLIRWLTGSGGGGDDDLKQMGSKVTTVWGMPGVGKTTLVAHVYNTVKVDFDAAAWVTVSESYHLEDLLQKIAAELDIPVDANAEMRGLAEDIHSHLQGKKYILVLDDVWTARCWSEIRNIFPISNCTGRFVITSRKHEVSLLATRESTIHLEPLQAHHSWVLFCKGAFWNDDDKECPLELQKLAWKFIAKCQGLPIALTCIGRLLSCKPPTSPEWENVYRGLDSQLAKDMIPDAHMILKVSLEDLPYGLRNCFLHCALFPEDYVLKRRTMMRHWIAAGFIREKEDNRTLEEVAEGYLTELVNRSLLQAVRRNHAGRLKHCRMHDVIRLLALNKAKEELFGEFYNGSAARSFSVECARRISIQGAGLEQLSRSGATHFRALHVFERYIDLHFLKPILTSSNLLSTLDLQGGVKVPNGIRHLAGLQAFQCVNASSAILCEVASLTELRSFGVCNVRSEHSTDLSNAITKMSHLVHLEIIAAAENEVLRLEGLLHFLELMKAFEGKRLDFHAGSFPKLRYLCILDAPQLNQVGIEEGAMQNLVNLLFIYCPKLELLPDGIEHLRALENLHLEETSEELIEKLRQKRNLDEYSEDVVRISHIRNVMVVLRKKGLSERIR